ncbi:zinc-ribbon domain-containing protein [Demequina sp. SO4-13]|uniref:zinc-ribbon domain-containing protein n=1 Tax=Demequina sp. SO4-13 TaxID=3401027 RepID=UPI003AF42FF8
MTLLEIPTKRGQHALTRCVSCGCEAHYRIDYALEKAPGASSGLDLNTSGVCRACHWREWAARNRENLRGYAPEPVVPVARAEAESTASAHGFDYLGPLTEPSLPNDPHHVRCKQCRALSAQRLGDIAFGCRCRVNARRQSPVERGKKSLLRDSSHPSASWWDHERNDPNDWNSRTEKAHLIAWWACPECHHRFQAKVLDMTSGHGCPACNERARAERQERRERLSHFAVADIPLLADAWDDDLDPNRVPVLDHMVRRFTCTNGHHPRVTPLTYLDRGCPFCRRQGLPIPHLGSVLETPDEEVAVDASLGAAAAPDEHEVWLRSEIASQWHPTRNSSREVGDVGPRSKRQVWWLCRACGHEWCASPADRDKGSRRRCPRCDSVLDSLAYHHPDLAKQWSASNPLSAWHVRPTGDLDFTPTWECAADPNHVWPMAPGARVNGAGCPECQQSGKSQVELDHGAAAKRRFGVAASGRRLQSPEFEARKFWDVDIAVDLPDGALLIIEYDGAYWHSSDERRAVDQRKTRDLLTSGAYVVRLREHPLLPLALAHARYREIVVYGTAPRPSETIEEVANWLTLASSRRQSL